MRDSQIEREFSFLESKFQKEKYTRNGDLDIVYTSKEAQITIAHYWGIDKNYHMDIIIETNGYRKNLLEFYELFEKDKLDDLKKNVKGRSIDEKILIISVFMKKYFFFNKDKR